MAFSITSFGQTHEGKPVQRCTLSDSSCSVSVLTWGATLQSVAVPGKQGSIDVLLGCDNMDCYEKQECYLGAFAGRVANRIAGGSFTFNGNFYQLFRNDGLNTLHGGKIGWDKRIFTVLDHTDTSFVLGLESPDGEEGFPGKIDVKVTYSLVPGGFSMEWEGVSDIETPFAPTCHAYWNLGGHSSGSILDQKLELYADGYTPINEYMIPDEGVAPVANTPFDFTQAKEIGLDISCGHPQLVLANGYDHNFVIRGEIGKLRPAAKAACADTGITMEMYTTLPGVQLYTGNFLQTPVAKDGAAYIKNSGFCLEPQYYPNFLNCSAFPQAILKPGIPSRHRTEWHFAVL